MSLNLLLILSAVALLLQWGLVYFRNPLIAFIARHPWPVKVAAMLTTFILLLLALLPLIFYFA